MMIKIIGLLLMAVFVISKADDEFVPNIPKECLKQSYCEYVPGYPEEHASKLVTALGNKKFEFFVNEETGLPEPIQNNPNEVPLCRAVHKYIIPQAAQDVHGTWHFVLNPGNNPLLRFRVEVCGHEQEPCDSVARFPLGYIASCSQKFIERVAPVIDTKGNLINLYLQFPCDCYCKVVSNNSRRLTPKFINIH